MTGKTIYVEDDTKRRFNIVRANEEANRSSTISQDELISDMLDLWDAMENCDEMID